MGESKAIASIEQSILKGWTGLFEVEDTPAYKPQQSVLGYSKPLPSSCL